MKKLILVVTITITVALSKNATVQEKIVDVAVGNEDFSTLVAVLTTADLVGTLQVYGPFTVFAPTNAAFAKIDSKALSSLLEEKNKKVLANILTYHLVSGKITTTDVVAGLKKGNGMPEFG
ncbi:fasciclin domain-containing protein [Patiriisocius sp. Uisw_017]|jgi:uncharacterized surface protein with fasciclin (FAS1) repeats|uniref:fasciclin domain-containing protein n=1 Tax=Patiriisocius sp. Uisw_017 TaxID=3230968 RepID=UPI0039EBBB96